MLCWAGADCARLADQKQNHAFTDLILHLQQFFTSLTVPTKTQPTCKNTKIKNFSKPMLKTDLTKSYFARTNTA